MDGDYLVQLYKYDHETGQPLKGAVFDLYERFDDKERMNRENRGVGEIYTDSMGHSPVFWDGFRLVTSVCTDESGHASYKLEKQYYYDKTFCYGHPAPAFGAAPEDGGENGDGDENEDSYGAKVYTDEEEYEEDDGGVSGAGSAELARQWLACVEACEARAEDGTHFHWIMDAVDAVHVKVLMPRPRMRGQAVKRIVRRLTKLLSPCGTVIHSWKRKPGMVMCFTDCTGRMFL